MEYMMYMIVMIVAVLTSVEISSLKKQGGRCRCS